MRPHGFRTELTRAATVLARRVVDARVGPTAAGLAFTTLISLVPLLALGLALFTAFPAFHALQNHLQQRLAAALLPPQISDTVMGYLNAFASRAKGLGIVGLATLAVAATSTMMTVDRALNAIWRTPRRRPLAQRVLLYWATLTLGPVVLGAGLLGSATIVAAQRGWMHAVPGAASALLTLASWLLFGLALAALFRFLPNGEVRWRDALAGGLFAALGFGVAGQAFAWYLSKTSSFAAVYGAFATLPIFLLWVYWSWTVVLLGASLAAALPAVRLRALPLAATAGASMVLALRVLRELDAARQREDAGRTTQALARSLRVDPIDLHPLLGHLESLGWIGRVEPGAMRREPRWSLLIDPARTPALALTDAFMLDHAAAAAASPALAHQLSTAWGASPLQVLLHDHA